MAADAGDPPGLKIKRARRWRGWSQKRLAQEIGDVSFKTVGNWERGLTYPRFPERVEEVLGISLEGPEPDPQEEAIRALGKDRGGFLDAATVERYLEIYWQGAAPRAG